jgi:hypothetical protein
MPLHVDPANPRWFINDSGRAVYLAGSHTWGNLRDMDTVEPPRPLDFGLFLRFLRRHGHTFFRLWAWDVPVSGQGHSETPYYRAPFPWKRTGPGLATDGKPRFDLLRLDQPYFDRVRERVAAAREMGIYVAVMLFDGYGQQFKRTPTDGFPFDGANNVNGISCGGKESQSLVDPAVTAVQETYVRKVIETVNDLDNVLYEIANEAGAYSKDWQYHVARFVKDVEGRMPFQHPVGISAMYAGGTNADLFDSPADWISPGGDGGYGWPCDPPPADGRKIVINDTDHSFYYVGLIEEGIAAWREWTWKSFTRGHGLAFMDPYLVDYAGRNIPRGPDTDRFWDPLRDAVGHAASLAAQLPLAAMVPAPALSSTRYCLADARSGSAYVVYAPQPAASFSVDLAARRGPLEARWLDTGTGQARAAGRVDGGTTARFTPPSAAHSVLVLTAPA